MEFSRTDLKNLLKEKGLKVTSQRQAILDVLLENVGKHLSPEEIYNIVKNKNPEIGVATVYRTLMLLEEMYVVHKIDLDDNCARYELNRNKEDHRHHHLICTICGTVLEVEEDLLESLELEIKNKKNFTVPSLTSSALINFKSLIFSITQSFLEASSSKAVTQLISVAVVITGIAFITAATFPASRFAPPIWPDSRLIENFPISSTTTIAGSDCLSLSKLAILLTTIPVAITKTMPSYVLKSSSTVFENSLNIKQFALMCFCGSMATNLSFRYKSAPMASLIFAAHFEPFFVIAITASFIKNLF